MSELIRTFCLGREVSVLWEPEEAEIEKFVAEGFIPVEMADGQKSYVDHRVLDHHNEYSEMPSACITALDYYGEADRAGSSKFMMNHVDADCVMTGVTLLGALPLDVLRELNGEVGALDTDPLSVDNSKLKYGAHIQCWKAGMSTVKKSGWSWLYGVYLFVDIIDNFACYNDALELLKAREATRIECAMADYAAAYVGKSGKTILISRSMVWGLDVQFGRDYGKKNDDPDAWRHWCIISRSAKSGAVLISCPNKAIAERAFGPGGLQNIFAKLPMINGKSWGGRESVGGSPRGEIFPEELMEVVLAAVDDAMEVSL